MGRTGNGGRGLQSCGVDWGGVSCWGQGGQGGGCCVPVVGNICKLAAGVSKICELVQV